MSFKSIVRSIFASSAAHAAIAVAATALTQAVQAAAQPSNPIGAAALVAVQAAEAAIGADGKALSGDQKKAQAMAVVVPLIVTAGSKNGLAVLEADAVQFGGMVIEEIVARMKQTPLLALATALLKQFS